MNKTILTFVLAASALTAFAMSGREGEARADATAKVLSIGSSSFQMTNIPIASVSLLTSSSVTSVTVQGVTGGKTYACILNVASFAAAAEIRDQIVNDKTRAVECIGNGSNGTVSVPIGPNAPVGPALQIKGAP